MDVTQSKPEARARAPTIEFAIGFAIVFYTWRLIGAFTRFPGTTIDARFNQVVLEHLWSWASGRAEALADPSFFYPYRGVFYLSDTHFGSGFVYVAFRALGAPREVAFDLWFLVGMAATFAASAHVFRRLGLPTTSALFGACAFTFSLPMLAQDPHAQLVYRFGVPLAALAGLEFCRRPNLTSLAALTLWVSWQFLCSVYVGVFLVELLALFGAVALLFPALAPMPSGFRHRGLGVLAVAALTLAAYMLWRHASVARLYAVHRDMGEIQLMAPRWASFLAMERAPTVGWAASFLPHYNDLWQWEHQLFPGVGVLLLAGAAVRYGDLDGRRALMFCLPAIVALMALAIDVDGFGLYRWVAEIPGLNAIRSPGRVAVVMAFPLAWLAAQGVTALRGSTSRIAAVVLTAGLGFALLDIAAFNSSSVEISAARARVAAMSAGLDGEALRAARAVLLRYGADTNEHETMNDLDLMIAAQDFGVVAINGYSGSVPTLYRRPRDCAEARAWMARVDALPYKRAGAGDVAARSVILPAGACP